MSVLLGQWGFLDNLEDTSGNGRHPSANFTPTYIDGPQPGTRAIRFSGSGQTIDYGRTGLEPAAATGGICTMGWIKLFSSHSGYTELFHKTRAPDSSKHSMRAFNDTVFWMSRWRGQLAFQESGSLLFDFNWHHIANIDADDRYAWFLDGVPLISAARSGTDPVVWEDFPWTSGYTSNMAGSETSDKVAISGIRIFSGTMSNSEVVDWMNTPIIPIGRSGEPKIWSGSSWDKHPAKVWDGSIWSPTQMNGYDGSDWVTSK
jgi:hypothetical protein